MANTTRKLRAGRTITQRGGYGMDVQVQTTRCTPQIYWSTRPDGHPGNSFVTDGTELWSVNGIGEIRWKVEHWNDDDEHNAARAYFFTDATEPEPTPDPDNNLTGETDTALDNSNASLARMVIENERQQDGLRETIKEIGRRTLVCRDTIEAIETEQAKRRAAAQANDARRIINALASHGFTTLVPHTFNSTRYMRADAQTTERIRRIGAARAYFFNVSNLPALTDPCIVTASETGQPESEDFQVATLGEILALLDDHNSGYTLLTLRIANKDAEPEPEPVKRPFTVTLTRVTDYEIDAETEQDAIDAALAGEGTEIRAETVNAIANPDKESNS